MLMRILLLFFLLSLAACQQQEPTATLLLTVGQRQLHLRQFERELQNSYPDLSDLSAAEQLQLKKQLVNRLIERELILGEAQRLAIQVGPDELDSTVRELRGSYSADEFAEILTLVQTRKTRKIPIILVGNEFWQGLLDWFRNTLCEAGTIDLTDLDLIQVCNEPKEVVDAIFDHYETRGFEPSPAEQEMLLEL